MVTHKTPTATTLQAYSSAHKRLQCQPATLAGPMLPCQLLSGFAISSLAGQQRCMNRASHNALPGPGNVFEGGTTGEATTAS